jgi:hypothetical protein
VPLLPDVIVIHPALLEALHAQPPPQETLAFPVPVVAAMLTLAGDIE